MGIQINGQTDTISAVDNNFSLAGNVSIGGTLTYEDVTSVDAIGLSTFKAGIQLDDSITHLGDENTKIRFPAADTVTVETAGAERLRIGTGGNGGTIGISTTLNMVTNSEVLAVRGYSSFKSNNQVRPALYIGNEGSVTDTANALILFNQGGANRGGIGYVPNTGELRFNNQHFFTFCTGASTLGGSERLRITSAGNIGIGTNNPAHKLDVRGTSVVANIKSTNNNYALQFAGNNCAYDVYVGSDNTNNFLLANENNDGTFTERLRITSAGEVGINNTSPQSYGSDGRNLVIGNSDSNAASGITLVSGTGGYSQLYFADGTSGSELYSGTIGYNHSENRMDFWTNGVRRLRITSDGRLCLGDTAVTGYEQIYCKGSHSGTSGIYIHNANGATNSSADLWFGNWTTAATNANYSARISALNRNVNTGITDLIFHVYDGNNVQERLRITSSGLVRVGHPTANHSSNVTQDLEIKGRYVNAAGDFSRLIFGNSDDSGGSTASIRAERTGNNFGTELKFFTNPQSSSGDGLERLRINRDGIVTKPYNPSFSCYKNGHFNFTSNTDTTIKPWTEQHDTHNDFNATTGVFTAPVAGKYFFYVTVMQQRQGNGDFQLKIYKNGALYVNSNDMNDAATTTFQQTTINAVMSLAANDTASFVTRNSTDTTSFLYQGQYTHCGGYLIG